MQTSSNGLNSTMAKAILGTHIQEFEDLMQRQRSLAPGQLIPFSRITSFDDFRVSIKRSLSELDLDAEDEDFYAHLSYHALLLQDFAREKQLFLLLDDSVNERTVAEWLQRRVATEVTQGIDWRHMNEFLRSEDAKQMSGDQKRIYILLLMDECLREFGLTVQVWLHEEDEKKDEAFITTVGEASVLEDLLSENEYSKFVYIESLADYRLGIVENSLPMTEDEQRIVRKKHKQGKVTSFIFTPIALFFSFLFVLTLADPHFLSPDSYYVAGFTGFVAFAAALLVLGSISEARLLKRVMATGRKKIIFGKVEEVMNVGSIRVPKFYLKLESEFAPVQIRILDMSSLSGVSTFSAIKKGDRVALHEAIQEPITLAVKVAPA